MNFANNLQSVPYSFIGISYAVAAYPSLTRFAVKKDTEGFIDSVNGVTQANTYFSSCPFRSFFLLLRTQVVRLILGKRPF